MSVSTSLSLWCSSRASVGRNCRTTLNLGGGFLFLHRFDKVHVMFLRKPAYWYKTIYHMWKDDYQCRGIGLFNLSLELLLFGDARNIFTGCLALLPVINFFFFRATGQQLLLLGYLMYFIIIAAYSLYISEVLNLPVLCAIFKFLTGVSVSISLNRGSTIPDSVTKSRRSGPSPTKHNGQSEKNLLLEQRD